MLDAKYAPAHRIDPARRMREENMWIRTAWIAKDERRTPKSMFFPFIINLFFWIASVIAFCFLVMFYGQNCIPFGGSVANFHPFSFFRREDGCRNVRLKRLGMLVHPWGLLHRSAQTRHYRRRRRRRRPYIRIMVGISRTHRRWVRPSGLRRIRERCSRIVTAAIRGPRRRKG